MKSEDAFEVVEVIQTPATDGVALAEIAQLVGEQQATTVSTIGRHLVRETIARLTRERSKMADQLEDAQEENRREQRAFYLKVLNILDSLDRLIRQTSPENELAESLTAIRAQFLEVLDDQEIALVDVVVGRAFDAALCEVSRRETRDDLPLDTILAIERKGYSWRGKTLRRARVIISTRPQGG